MVVSLGVAGPFIAGRREEGRTRFTLTDPYRGTPVAEIGSASVEDTDRAIRLAREGQAELAAMPTHARAAILERAAELLRAQRDELAPEISRQTGKPLKDTRREVNRAAETLRASADAARGLFGEQPPADAMSGGEGLLSFVMRVPVGVVGGITPYNAPLNLCAHKMGPALASGNAIVVKPASKAPLSALSLGRILVEAGAPASCVAVLPGGPEVGERIASSPDVGLVTFTGGRPAGERVLAVAGLKRVTLELGGNSATIIHADADVAQTAERLTWGAFANSGQSCNSAQRIYVHRSIFDAFAAAFAASAARLVVGDPLDPASDLGTMVDEKEARRVEAWIADAVAHGARVLAGGQRRGAAIVPTVLAGVPADRPVVCEEVFGPVAVLDTYDDLDEGLVRATDTPYGLVGAVFTRSLSTALSVARRLRVGSVMVNRPSNYRLDHLPYGGVKESGIGREGPRYAVLEMTEPRLVLIDA
jgi:acyl-CoA reductase-like NAD-dependent aldehyde dehydrogenase